MTGGSDIARHVARRLKITFFINSLEQGGAERQLAELISGLDRERFEPSLILCNGTDQLGYKLPIDRIRVLDAPFFPTPLSVRRLIREVTELRPDVLHTYMGWENLVGRFAGRRAGVRAVISSVRCSQIPRKHIIAEALTHTLTDALIVNSIGIRDELVARARIPEGHIHVVENGVDLKRFTALSEADREKERKDRGLGGKRVLVVPGRICAQKNQLGIVRALATMRRKGTLPNDALVLFAGRDSHVTYGPRVRTVARLSGIADHVRFLGVVGAIERLVGASEGMLLPSRYEGLSNAVIEAMAVGVPVIVSRAANTDALVRDGVSGIVVPGESDADLVAALESYFSMTPGARAAIARAGQAATRQRFTVGRMVASTVAVYAKVLRLGDELRQPLLTNGVNGVSGAHAAAETDRT